MGKIMHGGIEYSGGGGGGGGSSTFAGLSDVSLSNLADGQVPKYNATTQKWENANESSGGGVNYSTAEQVIGTWIDGKPLYQKTFSFTLTKNNRSSYGEYPHNIANVDTIFATDVSGIINKQRPFTGTAGTIGAWANTTSIVVETGQDRSTYNAVVTLMYTKTTDVAGSGKYAELGVPAVHYDDVERVVGTWFGKPLYQKTIDFGVMPSSTTKSVAHGISNIKRIVSIEGYSFNSTAGNLTVPLPFVSTSALGSQMDIRCDFTNVTVITGTGRQNFAESFVTLRYTKTTD